MKPWQYLFLNCAPGIRWNQNNPDSITSSLFREPRERMGTGSDSLLFGLAFILSYLDTPLPVLETVLQRLLALSEAEKVPVLITLDGENWWQGRPDLWNWFDPQKPGFDRANRENVERTDWDGETAVKICWRNWGRQIRVLPQPNLGAPRFREASQAPLKRLAQIVKSWGEKLPPQKRPLYPGVKIGWEASIGINAYHYPNGNRCWEEHPTDASHDPTGGMDLRKDFAGGLAPLGYAALSSLGIRKSGNAVTLGDQERIVADYLAFLSGVCHRAGLGPEEVFTHAGGQYAPWEKHYSHRIALNPNATPGWSLYGHFPEAAGDLAASLAIARRDSWCAAEWLPSAKTGIEWAEAIRKTLAFRECRFLDVYNYEGIRNNPAAVEGIRRALAAEN